LKNLHIVIGDSNDRKSSLIRCLTGIGQGGRERDVELASGKTISVHVETSSLQENYKPRLPINFILLIQSSSCDNFLFPLWVKSRNIYPAYSVYIADFINAGFNVENIALLGNSASLISATCSNANGPAIVLNPAFQASNGIASTVSKIWRWA
jgi:hypothetical protein